VNLSVKLLVPLAFLCLSAITACSSLPINNVPDNTGQRMLGRSNLQVTGTGTNSQIIDMGYQKGASISVKINISNNMGFNIKAPANQNLPGHEFIGTDINRVKVFIFAPASFSSGDPITPDPSMPSGAPITLTTKTGTISGGTFDVLFKNVPGNTVPWRVAIAVLTTVANAGGSTGTPRNITKGPGSPSYGTFNSENYGVSNSGGDSNSGTVLIDPVTMTLTGTTALGVPLTLIDGYNSTIETDIFINDGSSSITANSTYVE
jgi:hypothetical protein